MKKTAFLKWLSLGLLLGVSVACHDDDEDENNNNNQPQKEQQSDLVTVDPTPDSKKQLPQLVESQSLRFNLWASGSASWVGSFDGNGVPVTQYIDYVKVSSYDASTKSFKEEWTDEFESFNTSRWSKGNWKMELVQLSTDNVVVEDGVLKLKMTKQANEDGSYKYYGAELYSKETFKYGRFEAKMKMACVSGTVSSMFLYYNNSNKSGYNWNELDIEILGKNPKAFQSNIITGTGGSQKTEKVHSLNYSVSSDYHVYVMEWTPEYVSWQIDGVEMRRTVAQ